MSSFNSSFKLSYVLTNLLLIIFTWFYSIKINEACRVFFSFYNIYKTLDSRFFLTIVLLSVFLVILLSTEYRQQSSDGVSHEGRLIGRDARNREQEGNRDTRVRQVQAVSMT